MADLPRPRRKGEAIAIRLDVHVDDVFQAEAAARGMTARDLAADILTEWISGRRVTPVSTAAAAAQVHNPQGRASGLVDEFFGER